MKWQYWETGQKHIRPANFFISVAFVSLAELKCSSHRVCDVCWVEGLWHSKANTLQQPPVPKWEAITPLFLGGVSHKGKEAFGDGLECVSHSKSKFWHWTNDMFLDAVPAGSFWLQSFFFPGIKAFLVEF